MCARPAVQIHVDPFFDGEGTRVQRHLHSGYTTADQNTFETHDKRGNPTGGLAGRPISSVLPGRYGATVIPHANEGGVPDGFSPNVMEEIQVFVDPHIHGSSVPVNLGRVTEGMVDDARAAGEAATPRPRDIKGRRFRASASYHALSQATDTEDGQVAPLGNFPTHPEDFREVEPQPGQRPPAARAPVAFSGGNGHQVTAAPVAPVRRGLSAFQTPAAPRNVTGPAAPQSVAPRQSAPLPTVKVNFELELVNPANGAPFALAQAAQYHFVHLSDDKEKILLGWDARQGECYMPPEGENAPKLAFEVVGSPEVYLVQVLPIRYSHLQLPGVSGDFTIIQLVVMARTDGAEPSAQG